MAQSNAVQDQPSMEDILTSIRRIIDDGNAKPPNTSVPSAEEIANDDSVEAAQSLEGKTDNPERSDTNSDQIDEIPELDSFLEALDAKYNAQQQVIDTPDVVSEKAAQGPILEANNSVSESEDSSIAMIDDAITANTTPERDSSKYEARFSEDDRTAFVAVGDVLSAKTTGQAPAKSHAATARVDQGSSALVSEPSRARVGGSLNSLSDALAQEAQRQLPAMTESLLKPMLADWLDNNLPSMVERLVREEIERIARGD